MNTMTYPVRNFAPLRDTAGRLRRVWPELSRVEVDQVPANRAAHARFLWTVAQAQAVLQAREIERLEAQHRCVRTGLLEEVAALTAQRDRLRETLSARQLLTASEENRLAQLEDGVQLAEARLEQAHVGCAEALALAGLRGPEGFDLTPDERLHLGTERGFFSPLQHSQVWQWAITLPGVLVAPALWNGGLSAFWRGLGLPDGWDVTGLVFSGLVGVAVAHVLKAVVSEWAAQAAQNDAARRGVLPENAQAAHFRRWGAVLNLFCLLLVLAFAYIEGNLVMQALSSTDPAARLQGGSSPLLLLIGSLVALTPATLLGLVTGRQRGHDSVAAAYRARSCAAAQEAKLRRPEMQHALRATMLVGPAEQTVARAQARLAAARQEIQERQAKEQQVSEAQLNLVEVDLSAVKVSLDVLDADYSRRCEQLAQQADQAAAAAMRAFENLSRPGMAGLFQRNGQDQSLRGWRMKRLLATVRAAGATVDQGYIHILTVRHPLTDWGAELEHWLSTKVLPTKDTTYIACAVSVHSARWGRTCVVILMARFS